MMIALFQPEIPQNTGNIGRLCVATNTPLYLVRPLGFHLDSKEIRRSGLDYWDDLELEIVDSLDDIAQQNPGSRMWFLSTRGKKDYADIRYKDSDILTFGNEGSGLDEKIYANHENRLVRIPMWGPVRSLNLATSVGIALYEAYRQINHDKR